MQNHCNQSECKLLTIDFQQRVQKAVSLILQGIVGAQGHGEVTVGLLVTNKHLNICRKRKTFIWSDAI